MPHFDHSTPRVAREYNGVTFSVPMPYGAGHALTPGEASYLNGVIATRMGNSHSAMLRRIATTAVNEGRKAGAKPLKPKPEHIEAAKASVADHQAWLDNAYASFTPGERTRGEGGSGSTPIERLIRTLATEDVKARIIARGLKVQDFQRTKVTVVGEKVSKFSQLVEQLIERDHDRLAELAQRALDAQSADASEVDDLLDEMEGGEAQAA